jgi:hypothetical protein
MLKGILTIALKHPLYGRYAYNLALSIKGADPKQKICVLADKEALAHLHEGQKMMFDKIIYVDQSLYTKNDLLLPLLIKYHLYDLTPYSDETLFVDADVIFSGLCDFKELWSSYRKVDWTMANRGANDPDKGISEWVDSNKLKEAYDDIEQWIDLSSEWIYFKQNELSKSIFNYALEFYNEDKLHTRQFAGDKPDEPFFNLALNKVKHKPHKLPYQPTYWQPAVRKVLSALEIKKNYYAFSAGGNHLPPNQQKIYDEFAKNAGFRTKMQEFKIPHKRSQLKERTHI